MKKLKNVALLRVCRQIYAETATIALSISRSCMNCSALWYPCWDPHNSCSSTVHKGGCCSFISKGLRPC
jgi:hypothetical protein